uniref:Aminotransferase-like plant mobile domain-containing protein n=1 Tax=Chenopodium quinoa TaxID=63459 RepID=A0A803MYT3_CHEQI
MSVEIANVSDTTKVYKLQDTLLSRPATDNLLPLLGRFIIEGFVRWGSVVLKMYELGTRKEVPAKEWIRFWYQKKIRYAAPPKRTRYLSTPPQSTHDPDGTLPDVPTTWTNEELSMFERLGLPDNNRKGIAYTDAFLSCWLCAFVLPQCDSRSIRLATFEIATLMACGKPFSLAVPVLGSIYHGPLMTVFSGSQSSKHFKDKEARDLIHEGTLVRVGCTVPNKNKNIALFDNGKLEIPQFGYLISLRSSYIHVRSGDKLFIEPYNPHRFGRQFGFCQDVPGMLTHSIDDRQSVGYYEALRYWGLILFCGSQSRVLTPCLSLNWRDLVTRAFRSWWSKVTVNELRDKVDVLCASIETNPNNSRKSKEHAGETTAPRPKTNAGGTRCHEPLSRQGNSKSMTARDVSQGGSSSDGESDVNYKHKRRSKRRSDVVDEEDVILNDADSFSDLQDFLIVLTNIPLITILPLPRPNADKGKAIRITTNKVRDNSPSLPRKEIQSPTQSLKSVDGPQSLELASNALEVRQLVGDDRATSSQRVCAPTMSANTFRPGPFSNTIFADAIKTHMCSILGNVASVNLFRAESNLANEYKRQEHLKEQDAIVTKRVEDLEAELTKACEEKNRLPDDLMASKGSITSIEEQINATKQIWTTCMKLLF